MKAVRFEQYGGPEVLQVVDVPLPVPGPGQALVRVRAAGINPGEIKIREGVYAQTWPASFPSGQGSDFAGVIEALGPGVVGFAPGEAVIGFTNRRASQAEYVVEDAAQLTPKPGGVGWEVAGALFIAGTTAYAAVRAVNLTPDDTVAVSGATGGVGSLAVQLAALTGARVIGISGGTHDDWLRARGVTPVTYGDGLEERLRAASPGRLDAFIDAHGQGYVDLAVQLGVQPTRINTIIDHAAARQHGTKAEANAEGARASTLAELAGLIEQGRLELPVARRYPLSEVQAAYRELAAGHTFGKIVLTL